ncbi:MAG: A24 family peptidase [Geminicoccaceae bacterium]
MLPLLCLACLAGLLVVGTLTDIDDRRLPNWLTSAVVILYGLYVVVSPTPVGWMSAGLVAALVFALGFVCFAFNLMGGGDVKLMAGLALWAGVDHIALFLIITSLAGGLLAIVMLMRRHWTALPVAALMSSLFGSVTRKLARPAMSAGSSATADLTDVKTDITLPYGVAIAAGGFAIIFAILQP